MMTTDSVVRMAKRKATEESKNDGTADKRVQVAARVRESLVARLQACADESDRTLSYMIEKSIAFYLSKMGKQ